MKGDRNEDEFAKIGAAYKYKVGDIGFHSTRFLNVVGEAMFIGALKSDPGILVLATIGMKKVDFFTAESAYCARERPGLSRRGR